MEMKQTKMCLHRANMPEVRCYRCNRLLFCGIVHSVQIKCPRCGTVQFVMHDGLCGEQDKQNDTEVKE